MTDEVPKNMEMQSTKPEKTDEIVYSNTPTLKTPQKEENEVIQNRRTTLDALEELEEKDGAIFSDSTHRYLVYYRTLKSKSGFFLALLVLITQISLYAILEGEPRETVEAGVVPVEILYDECGDYLGRHDFARMYNNNTVNYTANTLLVEGGHNNWGFVSLQCEQNEWQVWTKDNVGVFILSLVLIWCFTAPDFLSSVAVIARVSDYWAKFVGVVLLFELFFAVHICNLNLFAALYSANKFDAILNTVGVLFIHDMDEAMFSALKIIDKKYVEFCKNSDNKFWKFVKEHVQVLVMLAYGILICIAYAISRATINPE